MPPLPLGGEGCVTTYARARARGRAWARDVDARGLRSHTDPTPACNAERLCGITHWDRHSETGNGAVSPTVRQIVRIDPEQT